MTTTAWKKLPGSFDPLHRLTPLPSASAWDIPALLPQPEDLWPPDDLYAYRYTQKIRTERPILLHFHTDDWRFEAVWNEPTRGLRAVGRPAIWAACTPDFSLWLEDPLAMQIWNTYRNRWIGRLWQYGPTPVIPSVNWSHAASFDFCFDGIPLYQIITIRTYRTASPQELDYWTDGYQTMIHRLLPRLILWFGVIPRTVNDDIPKLQFSTDYYEKGDPRWVAAA